MLSTICCWVWHPAANSTPATTSDERLSVMISFLWMEFVTQFSRSVSGNHSAIEHLVHDRTGDLIEERLAHLLVIAQETEDALFLRAWRLAAVLPELFTTRALVFLDHLVRDHVQHRIGLRKGEAGDECDRDGDKQQRTLGHFDFLSIFAINGDDENFQSMGRAAGSFGRRRRLPPGHTHKARRVQ